VKVSFRTLAVFQGEESVTREWMRRMHREGVRDSSPRNAGLGMTYCKCHSEWPSGPEESVTFGWRKRLHRKGVTDSSSPKSSQTWQRESRASRNDNGSVSFRGVFRPRGIGNARMEKKIASERSRRFLVAHIGSNWATRNLGLLGVTNKS
jgi:hypothetical protein